MKNKDIERYDLTDVEKAELRTLRNLRRNTRKNRKRKVPFEPKDQQRMHELMANGRG